MRNQSFMHTQQQYEEETKTVTRRLGWKFARVGDVVRGCRKCQGLKKGEQIEIIGYHRFANLRREPLRRMIDEPEYGAEEVIKEGFPEMTPAEFVDFFCKAMKCKPETLVHRMEYEYISFWRPSEFPAIAIGGQFIEVFTTCNEVATRIEPTTHRGKLVNAQRAGGKFVWMADWEPVFVGGRMRPKALGIDWMTRKELPQAIPQPLGWGRRY